MIEYSSISPFFFHTRLARPTALGYFFIETNNTFWYHLIYPNIHKRTRFYTFIRVELASVFSKNVVRFLWKINVGVFFLPIHRRRIRVGISR